MKTTTFVAAAILAATVVSGATSQEITRSDDRIPVFGKASSYQKANIQRLEKAYLASLNFPLDAVVECAIREVTRLKLAQLCCQSKRIQERLQELVVDGRTPAVRYKAMLASMVFDRPSVFAPEGTVDYVDEAQLYSAITHRLEKELLAINIQ